VLHPYTDASRYPESLHIDSERDFSGRGQPYDAFVPIHHQGTRNASSTRVGLVQFTPISYFLPSFSVYHHLHTCVVSCVVGERANTGEKVKLDFFQQEGENIPPTK